MNKKRQLWLGEFAPVLLMHMQFQISTRIEELRFVACALTWKHKSMLPLDMTKPIINGLKTILWFVACFEQANIWINIVKDVPSGICQILAAENFWDVESETDIHRSFFNSTFVKNFEQYGHFASNPNCGLGGGGASSLSRRLIADFVIVDLAIDFSYVCWRSKEEAFVADNSALICSIAGCLFVGATSWNLTLLAFW